MKEASFWTKDAEGVVRCGLCAQHCRIRLVQIGARFADRQQPFTELAFCCQGIGARQQGRLPQPVLQWAEPQHGFFEFAAQRDELDLAVVVGQFGQVNTRGDFDADSREMRQPALKDGERRRVIAYGEGTAMIGAAGGVEEEGQ